MERNIQNTNVILRRDSCQMLPAQRVTMSVLYTLYLHTIEANRTKQVSWSNKNDNHTIESRDIFCFKLVKSNDNNTWKYLIVVSLPYTCIVIYISITNHISICLINTFYNVIVGFNVMNSVRKWILYRIV